MQESYVSLDPTYAQQKRQAYIDRERVFRERIRESRGGDGAETMGYLSGLTAGYWTYYFISGSGFSFLPL